MRKFIPFLISVILTGSLTLVAQETAQPEEPYFNTDAYIELLKLDIKAQKVVLITEGMELTKEESDKFWPVYKEYAQEVGDLFDDEMKLLKDYAENYETMREDVAKSLLEQALKNDTKRLKLKEKYVVKMGEVLPASKTARFYQLDNRINMLINLQIASQLPLIKYNKQTSD